MIVLISWCLLLFIEKIPFTKADEYFPFKLQLISFLQKFDPEDKINEFYTKQFSNVGRSVHYLAVAATNLYENTRSSVQKYINAKDKNEIVFTKGATEALNLVANTLGQKYLNEGDEILITELEHHSNYVPWHFLRKSKNIKINFAEVNEDGDISLEDIEKKNNF